MDTSSSPAQSRLNSQSVSTINPDYYVDQNKGKQCLVDVDHATLTGNNTSLTLNRDMIHNKIICINPSDSGTYLSDGYIYLPSSDVCIGMSFELIILDIKPKVYIISPHNNLIYTIVSKSPERVTVIVTSAGIDPLPTTVVIVPRIGGACGNWRGRDFTHFQHWFALDYHRNNICCGGRGCRSLV
jgi:hypothetical protein